MTVRRGLTVTGLLLTAFAGPVFAGPAPIPFVFTSTLANEIHPPVPADRLRATVAELGHRDFERRERAQTELLAMGEKAQGQLRRALTAVSDTETRRRLTAILQTLEFGGLKTARTVTLVASRMPAPEAFRRIARQAGYRLRADGLGGTLERTNVHDFNLKSVPFWEAIDAIGNASGLAVQVEEDGLMRVYNQDAYNPHVSYSGPFRFVANQISSNRFLPLSGLSRQTLSTSNPEQLGLNLTVFAEPKATLVGTRGPWVVKMVDEIGKPVPQAPADTSVSFTGGGYKSFTHNLHLTFHRPAKEAMRIKELTAKAGLTVLTEAKPDAVVKDLAKAKGQKVKGRTAELEFTDVAVANESVTVTVTVTNPAGNPNDYQWVNALWQRFEVTDRSGVPFSVNVTNTNFTTGNQVTCTFQATPQDGAKVGPAVTFTFVEWVTRTIDVEFTFKDLPLP